MELLMLTAAGGAVGAVVRYLVGMLVSAVWGSSFPWGTLAVNSMGSFLMGAVCACQISAPASAFIMQGFCGALTTFSTFSLDNFRLFREGNPGKASANIFMNLALGIGAAAVGFMLFGETA